MSILEKLNEDLAAVGERALSSLVRVHNGRRGAGAGTIWHPDGLIVTNAHVVAGHRSLAVTLPDGRELPARVLAEDTEVDLAALRVDAHGLPTIELGDSRRLHPGDTVMALGFPWGVTGGATVGVVIGVDDGLPEERPAGRDWLAASLHLRPGHSGGPMVNSAGRLVGINTLMNGPDVGVAVPVHVAVAFLKRALAPQTSQVAQV